MSTNLSRLAQPFVTSVVVGKDVVPRVSVVNLGRLIDQMVIPFNLLSSVKALKGHARGRTQVPYHAAVEPCKSRWHAHTCPPTIPWQRCGVEYVRSRSGAYQRSHGDPCRRISCPQTCIY
jgi:hypothetical protein